MSGWARPMSELTGATSANSKRKVAAKRVALQTALPEQVMCQEPPDGLGEADAYRAMCSAIYDFLTWPIPPYAVKRGTGEKTKVPSARRRGIGLRSFVRKMAR